MAYFDYGALRTEVQERLQEQKEATKKLVLVHSGVVLGLGLAVAVVGYILHMGMMGTTGLGGIGTRAMLETVQTLLEGVHTVLMPFWTVSYLYGIVMAVRRQPTGVPVLRWGFRHWGVVLRSLLLQGMIYLGVAFLAMELGSAVYMMTPAAESLNALMMEMAQAGVTDVYEMMDNEAYWYALLSMAPYLLTAVALVLIPTYYRLRFTNYLLVETPGQGALRALRGSIQMTRRKGFAVFRLDMHFWWFYLAQVAIAMLGFGDLVLGLLGVELGAFSQWLAPVCGIAAMICEFLLFVWQKNRVYGVYALAYAQMRSDWEQPAADLPTDTEQVGGGI